MYNELVDKEMTMRGVRNTNTSFGYIEHRYLTDDYITDIINHIKDKIPHKVKMCDLGIGYGKVIYHMAHKLKDMGYDVEVVGIEWDKSLTQSLSKLKEFWEVPLEIIGGDIRNHDISKYDFVYLYHPLKHMKEFWYNTLGNLKDGAIMFDPSFIDIIQSDDIITTHVNRVKVYQKKTNNKI